MGGLVVRGGRVAQGEAEALILDPGRDHGLLGVRRDGEDGNATEQEGRARADRRVTDGQIGARDERAQARRILDQRRRFAGGRPLICPVRFGIPPPPPPHRDQAVAEGRELLRTTSLPAPAGADRKRSSGRPPEAIRLRRPESKLNPAPNHSPPVRLPVVIELRVPAQEVGIRASRRHAAPRCGRAQILGERFVHDLDHRAFTLLVLREGHVQCS